MAKEEIKNEEYFLDKKAKSNLYWARIDGWVFIINPAVYVPTTAGPEKLKPLTCFQYEDKKSSPLSLARIKEITEQLKPNPIEGFLNLNWEQRRVLYEAKIIKLTKPQQDQYRKDYSQYLKELKLLEDE